MSTSSIMCFIIEWQETFNYNGNGRLGESRELESKAALWNTFHRSDISVAPAGAINHWKPGSLRGWRTPSALWLLFCISPIHHCRKVPSWDEIDIRPKHIWPQLSWMKRWSSRCRWTQPDPEKLLMLFSFKVVVLRRIFKFMLQFKCSFAWCRQFVAWLDLSFRFVFFCRMTVKEPCFVCVPLHRSFMEVRMCSYIQIGILNSILLNRFAAWCGIHM